MWGETNAKKPGGTQFSLVVSVTSGSLVTASKSGRNVSGTAVNGQCVLTLPEAGTWTVSATLDGQTSNSQTVSVVESYAVTLTFFEATITVTAPSGATVTCSKGSTSYQETSTGTVVFTVTETGTWTITAQQGGQSTSGQVNVTAATNYSITLSFVDSTLNNNDWSTISEVSDASQGANYWSVGDRKQVTLNGTMSKLTLSNYSTYAFILGFNHNSSREGSGRIHFQIGKTALSGGKDICLVSGYSDDSDFYMNTSNTNSGGWEDSYMRNNILGTSKTSYSGKFIGVLPSALRNVLKSVTKYTDNTGNSSTSSSAVTATTDYAFLLSEYEVFGSCTYANSNEASRQQQYAYYSAGNSKIKYNHSSTGTAIGWWLRSPRRGNSTPFVFVNNYGSVSTSYASRSDGVAPGFCV